MSSLLDRYLVHAIVAVGLVIAVAIFVDANRGAQRMQMEASSRGVLATDLNVKEIRCTICRATMTDALRKTAGVIDLEPTWWGLAVVYDGRRTSPGALVSEIDGLGFHAAVRSETPNG